MKRYGFIERESTMESVEQIVRRILSRAVPKV